MKIDTSAALAHENAVLDLLTNGSTALTLLLAFCVMLRGAATFFT